MSQFSLNLCCKYAAPFRRVEVVSSDTKTALHTLSVVLHQTGQRRAVFRDSKMVVADMPNQSGLLGYSFCFQLFGRKSRTTSAWKDEASRDRFASSPIHHSAVKNSRVTTGNMCFICVDSPIKELPTKWTEAFRLLENPPCYE